MFDRGRAERTTAGMREFYLGQLPALDPLALFRQVAADVPAYLPTGPPSRRQVTTTAGLAKSPSGHVDAGFSTEAPEISPGC
jgi:hypothetical protein